MKIIETTRHPIAIALVVALAAALPAIADTHCSAYTIAGTYAYGYFGQSGPPFAPQAALPAAEAAPFGIVGLITFTPYGLRPNGSCQTSALRLNLAGVGIVPPPDTSMVFPSLAPCEYVVHSDCTVDLVSKVNFQVGGQTFQGDYAERLVIWGDGSELRSISQKTGIPGSAFWGRLRQVRGINAPGQQCSAKNAEGVYMHHCSGYQPAVLDPAKGPYLAPVAAVTRSVCDKEGICEGLQYVGVAGGSTSNAIPRHKVAINSDCTFTTSVTVQGPAGPIDYKLNGVMFDGGDSGFMMNVTPGTGVILCELKKLK